MLIKDLKNDSQKYLSDYGSIGACEICCILYPVEIAQPCI